MKQSVQQRFWSKVLVGKQDECWPWQSSKGSSGHGLFKLDGRYQGAHRVVYEWANGPLPEGYVVRHRCDNPCCCNLWHLEPGTRADNVRDAVERGRMPSGERNGSAKLTAHHVKDIRELARAGASRAELSRLYGVSAWTIGAILRGKLWGKISVLKL